MEKATSKWFVEMTTKFNELAMNLGLESPAIEDLRTFMIETSKNQFKAGNKSGIRWALSDEGKAYFAARA